MATITGYTASRMQAIEDSAIVDGEVVGDNLILTRYNTTTIDAGSVRGPTGSPGVTLSELNVALSDHLPPGIIQDYIGTVAPSDKWLTMVGQTVVNGQTLYPDLWDVLPASMKSGSSILMPDTRGRVTVGYNSGDTDFNAIGNMGGAKTHTLSTGELPVHAHAMPHTHPIDHNHGNVATDSQGAHTHTLLDQNGLVWGSGNIVQSGGGPYNGTNVNAGVAGTAASAGAHTHNVDLPNFVGTSGSVSTPNTSNAGSGTAHNNLQPYITFMKIIKVL